jgi:hypothetical protein
MVLGKEAQVETTATGGEKSGNQGQGHTEVLDHGCKTKVPTGRHEVIKLRE